MRLMKPPDRLWSESISLLGATTDTFHTGDANWKAGFAAGPSNAEIPADSSQTIVTDLWCGMTNSHYLLPGRFPLTIELELVGDAAQCCPAGSDAAGIVAPPWALLAGL